MMNATTTVYLRGGRVMHTHKPRTLGHGLESLSTETPIVAIEHVSPHARHSQRDTYLMLILSATWP